MSISNLKTEIEIRIHNTIIQKEWNKMKNKSQVTL